jgi:hypothetical protein
MKYLGIPLSVKKVPKSAWQPLVDRVADKLPIWKGNLIQCSGRLIVIKTTLAAIAIYLSISKYGASSSGDQGIMMAFLLIGKDTAQGGKCLVAWEWV